MNLLEIVKYTRNIRERQYSTGKVMSIGSKYTPQNKQLWIDAQSQSSDKSKLYKLSIVFEGITNKEEISSTHQIPYIAKEHDVPIYLSKIDCKTRVRTRCSCEDYYFMWSYWNSREKALVGAHKRYIPVRPPSGRPPVNPSESPGACKHLLALFKKLIDEKLIAKDSTVDHYLNQPVRK